jgi:hypothetical protein
LLEISSEKTRDGGSNVAAPWSGTTTLQPRDGLASPDCHDPWLGMHRGVQHYSSKSASTASGFRCFAAIC